jgi:Asp-tRNA(Asn)/Glu-tRNA(Gln) amidotransferase A subunit family amidase
MDFSFPLSLSESVQGLRSGSIEPESFIDFVCERIQKTEPSVQALLPEEGRRERLLREVKMVKEKYPSPGNRPLLYCIPVGVKDLFRVDGFATQAGSQLPVELFSGKESSVVTRLKEAGALILGKTVTTEFAYFEPGPTGNPHDPSYTPGGSSSGSAAAVASGMTPVALGTQTIGSITRPASFCGVFGFKPSFGRIATDGLIPFSTSADHVGFFTQDLQGINLVASILCTDWKEFSGEPARKQIIGIPTGKYLDQADPEVKRFFEFESEKFRKSGHTLLPLNLFEDIAPINAAHRCIIASEFAAVHANWFDAFEPLYKHHTKELIREGRSVDKNQLTEAKNTRSILLDKVNSVTERYGIDLWLSPSSCTAALPGLKSTGSPLMNLPWTFLGFPTVSVPAGKNPAGLPLGLQFSGSFMQDEQLLKKLEIVYSQE